MDTESLLVGLNAEQRRAVTSTSNPLCILAGAGSGKTRVLTRRIAWRALAGDADPRHVLALTFTRKAAGELSGRLRELGLRDVPAAGTFHATAWAQLRSWWEGGDRRPPTLLDRKTRILRGLIDRGDRMTAAELAGEIEWAKARLVSPSEYPAASAAARRRITAPPNLVASRYARYEEEKQRKGLVDFDDLLSRCADALEQDATFGDAQRWRFRHLFVDEYQDVNPLQHRLLMAWLGDRDDLCVVGDPNQAIYRWNGADASFLTGFSRHFPTAEVVDLVDNYRSSPQILAVAAAVLDGGAGPSRRLRATRPDGPVPEVVVYATDVDEANGIARALRDHHGPGRRWSAQAVLVRTNAQTLPIAQALRRARIPYRVRGGSGLLDDHWIRGLLRAACPDGRRPFSTALADLEALVVDSSDPGAVPDLPIPVTEEQQANLEVIVALGREFLVLDPRAGASAFPAWLAASMRSDGNDSGGDAVDLVSFHAAKGLEWEIVHLAGLEHGFVPISHAKHDAEAEAEERRLLYVAITRAERHLRVTWAAQRAFGERVAERSPSPWLPLVVSAAGVLRRSGAPAVSIDALSEARSRLDPSAVITRTRSDDPSLLDALRTWRARVARGAGVPPQVVLSDRTLDAVARTQPVGNSELSGLPGLGPLKVAEHGDTLLALVADHRAANVQAEAPCGSN